MNKLTLKVIDVIDNNNSDMIIEITLRNHDGELVECFRGMLKDIPYNFNEYNVLVIGFSDCASIHIEKPETENATPEVTAPVEENEQPDDVPETLYASYPLDVPFDMRIKYLCRVCNHLEECFYSERSKVLEYYANHEYCGDVCGECTLCCEQFESRTNIEEILSDCELPF